MSAETASGGRKATGESQGRRAAVGGRRTKTSKTEKSAATNAKTSKAAEGLRAVLFDAGGSDQVVELADGMARRLRKDQLLWVDVDASSESATKQLRGLVELDEDDLSFGKRLPVRQRGGYFTFRLPALAEADEPRIVELICIVSEGWLITVHDRHLPFMDAFDDHVRSDSALGALDAAGFIASLLEWELNEYFRALEAVHREVAEIEKAILSDELHEAVLGDLVALRARLTALRDGLSPQRYVFATLAHPSFDVTAGTSAAADFALLNDRLEQAVQATDSARETIVGAFELYMTMTAQHTNEVMKVLTTVSLLLLPATVIAGIFGMNMLPKIFLHEWFFAVVIGVMVAVGATLLLVMRRLRWL